MATWILVAESSRAKLYELEEHSVPLVEVEDIINPLGRMHEGDLISDSPGSDGGSVGQGRRVLDNETSARDHEDRNFAKLLADRVEVSHRDGSFRKLVLIAPPAFLGLLREELSKNVMGAVTRQVDKNLVQHAESEIRAHL